MTCYWRVESQDDGSRALFCARPWPSLGADLPPVEDRRDVTYYRGEKRALVPSRKSETKRFLIYSAGLKIKGRASRTPSGPPPSRSLTSISGFSDNSRRALRFTAVNAWPQLISQFCLTYHQNFPQDGKVTKAHLHRFLVSMRKLLNIRAYLWVLEFQQRGAPHYHVFLPVKPSADLSRRLASIWLSASDQTGDLQTRLFHEHPSNFIAWDMGTGSYLTKYIEKSRQKDVPEDFKNVGRFWGASRGLVPVPVNVSLDDFAESYCAAHPETGECNEPLLQVARWLGNWYQSRSTHIDFHQRKALRVQQRAMINALPLADRPEWKPIVSARSFRRNFRLMAMNTGWTLVNGAAAFRQIEAYLFLQVRLSREYDDEQSAKLASYEQRKIGRKNFNLEAPPVYQDAISENFSKQECLFKSGS